MELPDWKDCDERKEQLNSSMRTIMQSFISGDRLNPLEEFIHSQEPIGELGKEFRRDLQKAIDWCIENK